MLFLAGFLIADKTYHKVEENKDNIRNEIFSERVRAGKRTYFFDIKETRSSDYYLTITESKRRFKEDGFVYEKHKIFLYKEDFEKFVTALNNSIDHVKTELLPGVDFNEFEHRESTSTEENETEATPPTKSGLEDETETKIEIKDTDLTGTGEETELGADLPDESEDSGDSDLKWE